METMRPYEKFADVYDFVTPDEFYSDYFDFIMKILKKLNCKPKKILDLACGTGRLAKIFLDEGYDVEGLDISESMLEIATRRALGLKAYLSNMVAFNLEQKYDLILCIYDSLNYILHPSNLKKCFNSINKHLNQDGIFIFDMNSEYKINKVLPEYKADYYDFGDAELIWLNSHQPDLWIGKVILFKKTQNGKYERFCEKYIERAYKLSTIKKLLKEANFEILETYSDFKRAPIKKDSKRLFFFTRKKTD